MKNPIRYIKNAIRVLKLKIRFGNKVQIGWIQSFEKIRIEKDRVGWKRKANHWESLLF